MVIDITNSEFEGRRAYRWVMKDMGQSCLSHDKCAPGSKSVQEREGVGEEPGDQDDQRRMELDIDLSEVVTRGRAPCEKGRRRHMVKGVCYSPRNATAYK